MTGATPPVFEQEAVEGGALSAVRAPCKDCPSRGLGANSGGWRPSKRSGPNSSGYKAVGERLERDGRGGGRRQRLRQNGSNLQMATRSFGVCDPKRVSVSKT